MASVLEEFNYIVEVRCGDSLSTIIRGDGVLPGSAIKRCGKELTQLRSRLAVLIEQEMLLELQGNR